MARMNPEKTSSSNLRQPRFVFFGVRLQEPKNIRVVSAVTLVVLLALYRSGSRSAWIKPSRAGVTLSSSHTKRSREAFNVMTPIRLRPAAGDGESISLGPRWTALPTSLPKNQSRRIRPSQTIRCPFGDTSRPLAMAMRATPRSDLTRRPFEKNFESSAPGGAVNWQKPTGARRLRSLHPVN